VRPVSRSDQRVKAARRLARAASYVSYRAWSSCPRKRDRVTHLVSGRHFERHVAVGQRGEEGLSFLVYANEVTGA